MKLILFFCFFSALNYFSVTAQKLVKGYYITTTKDTVFCSMPKYKGFKEETNTYRQIEVVSTSENQTLYPKQIRGYGKDGAVYRSFVFFGKNVFVKLLVPGKIELYYYSDEAENGHYIFKRDEEEDFNVMDYTFHVSKIQGPNPTMSERSTSSGLYIRPKDRTFFLFFSEYFKDYEPVVRKIKTEFYTKDDMIDIFSDYNASFVR